MRLRPVQAVWFETYVPHEHTVRATEVLAKTGVVQLELDPRVSEPVDVDRLRYFVGRFRDLVASHGDDLPAGNRQPTALLGNSVHIANQALHRLRVWSARVDYLNEHLAELHAERDYLGLLDEALEAMHAAGLDLDGVFRRTRFLCKCLFACPHGCCAGNAELQSVVKVVVNGPRHDFPFLVGLPEQRQLIRRMVVEEGCEQVGIPPWLSNDHGQQRMQVQAHREQIDQEIETRQAELQRQREDAEIAGARANVETLDWYLQHAAGHLTEREWCHITGWTTGEDPDRLQQILHAEGIQAVVRFPTPPSTLATPVATLDTWWSRPYRPLLVLWGTPGRTEVDPSGVMALVVPLLFGYMFPDLGHGLMLVLIAALFSRRWPQLRFLLPCGVSAMAFGLLFGEVFGFDALIPPLWLKPLDDPIGVLAVPLLFGAMLMLLGLVFAGFEAHWRGELRRWLRVDAAVLLLYVSLPAGWLLPQVWWLSAAAVLQYFVGSLSVSEKPWPSALLSALGELLLSVFELVMNTSSFLRVGAFALAHAALSHAVMTLAAAVEHPAAWLLVVVLGNLFSLAMEGLLVFVQTTRLVLFEFFIRFLKAEGRLFRPVRQPPATL